MVWFDALVTNVDRTAQNPNLLLWHGALWLIDHGAALYFHHARRPTPRARAAAVRGDRATHVLLPYAGSIVEADARLAPRVDGGRWSTACRRRCRDEWLDGDDADVYARYLRERLDGPRRFAGEAEERACPRVTRSRTRSSASCRASSAASG